MKRKYVKIQKAVNKDKPLIKIKASFLNHKIKLIDFDDGLNDKLANNLTDNQELNKNFEEAKENSAENTETIKNDSEDNSGENSSKETLAQEPVVEQKPKANFKREPIVNMLNSRNLKNDSNLSKNLNENKTEILDENLALDVPKFENFSDDNLKVDQAELKANTSEELKLDNSNKEINQTDQLDKKTDENQLNVDQESPIHNQVNDELKDLKDSYKKPNEDQPAFDIQDFSSENLDSKINEENVVKEDTNNSNQETKPLDKNDQDLKSNEVEDKLKKAEEVVLEKEIVNESPKEDTSNKIEVDNLDTNSKIEPDNLDTNSKIEVDNSGINSNANEPPKEDASNKIEVDNLDTNSNANEPHIEDSLHKIEADNLDTNSNEKIDKTETKQEEAIAQPTQEENKNLHLDSIETSPIPNVQSTESLTNNNFQPESNQINSQNSKPELNNQPITETPLNVNNNEEFKTPVDNQPSVEPPLNHEQLKPIVDNELNNNVKQNSQVNQPSSLPGSEYTAIPKNYDQQDIASSNQEEPSKTEASKEEIPRHPKKFYRKSKIEKLDKKEETLDKKEETLNKKDKNLDMKDEKSVDDQPSLSLDNDSFKTENGMKKFSKI